jgi:hypothetical protein
LRKYLTVKELSLEELLDNPYRREPP